MGTTLLDTLKSRFRPIEGSVPHTLMDMVHEFGSGEAALLYSCLFVPRFVEIDGSVLINLDSSNLNETFRAAKSESKLSVSEIEASFNFLELPYIFSDRSATFEELRLLAAQIREAWECHLRAKYPTRRFAVNVVGADVTGEDIGIQFNEQRD